MIKRLILPCLGLLLMGCSEPAPRTSLFNNTAAPATTAQVTPKHPVRLPEDHGAHPQYQLEWWYLTLVLQDKQQTPYAAQFTLFRFLTNPPYESDWADAQQWMGHVSLHSPEAHVFRERFAAGKVGTAGITASPFSAFIDDWLWQGEDDEPFPSTLQVKVDDHSQLALSMQSHGPYVAHGQQGYSVKSRSQKYRSYYYSQPFIDASGQLTLNNKTIEVEGSGWFDHEWSSQLADKDALGWDWFSLHLDNGAKLMMFAMHVNNQPPYLTGTYITAQGQATTLKESDLSIQALGYERINKRKVPVKWQLDIVQPAMSLTIKPFKKGQWNESRFSYYEGRVEITGSHQGDGFMELTGYQ